jgi:anti-anti-sigma regulatory factor
MKRHLTLATRREYALRDVQTTAAFLTGLSEGNGYLAVTPEAPQGGASERPMWRHTLVLTGMLDYYSAAELEDEIENLREEGVEALTLDLRQLDGIDSQGVQVIAAQGALFREGGRDFEVVPGLRRRVAEDPRLAALLADSPGERTVPRFSRVRVPGALRERCTTMIQYLVPYSQAEGG